MKRIGWLAVMLVSLSFTGFADTTLKRRMLSDLDFIQSVFEVKYAPLTWKGEYASFNLNSECARIRAEIEAHPNMSLKQYQILLKELFNATKDYHVGITFYSTEEAALPFTIRGTPSHRYFVVFADKKNLPSNVRLDVGDELLSFGGRPVHDVVSELKEAELGDNTPETDQALAERLLTHRMGDRGHVVPQGDVRVSVKKRSGAIETYTMRWNYYPEKIRDTGRLGAVTMAVNAAEPKGEFAGDLKDHPLLNKMMVTSHYLPFTNKRTDIDNPHELGAKNGFLPLLGKKLWKSSSESTFDAYIFQNASGKKVGYVRIPNYFGDEEEVADFAEIIALFEARTDALVIDQLNNPGGSLFYLYALASHLTDRKLTPPKHRIALTQQEVAMAVTLLPILDLVNDESTAQELFGETLGGYPISYGFIVRLREFFHFIINEWDQGIVYTRPTNVFGFEQIEPDALVTYTKPILLLVNSLDFSGGDFFPAILQDNKRARILGTRTAGAGGFVFSNHFPNHTGIHEFHLTGSLAERLNNKPLENLGVVPDVYCPLTERDFQENYVNYVNTVLGEVDALLKTR